MFLWYHGVNWIAIQLNYLIQKLKSLFAFCKTI